MSTPKPNINIELYKLNDTELISNPNQYSPSTINDCSLEALKEEFDAFERIDLQNDSHRKELDLMFPNWLILQASERNLKRFMLMSRYDSKNNTFIGGCFENTPDYCRLVSHKKRRLSIGKWITRKGTHPNSSLFIIIYPDGKPIYFIEGIHDSHTATLLGINFVMIPYAGYKNQDSTLIKKEVSGRDVIFLVEDKAAYTCMLRLAKQIEDDAKGIKLKNLGNTDRKIDLSDYVKNFNSIKEVTDGLQDYR